jgi:AAA+ superfamily predicted ATPase
MTETNQVKKSRGQDVADDVVGLLRSRHPLLWVITSEEKRVEKYLFEAAGAAGYISRTWDCGQGIADVSGKPPQPAIGGNNNPDADGILQLIEARTDKQNNFNKERCVWVLRDLPVWFSAGLGSAQTIRRVRNLARKLPGVERDYAQAVIIITPSTQIPPDLAGHATVIEWPLPDRIEIGALLDAAIKGLPEKDPKTGEPLRENAAPNGTRELAIDAAVGLAGEEASNCYAKSLVTERKISPAAVAREKKKVITRERVLEWYDPLPGGLDSVGGLENLKEWLETRKKAYSKEARAYGLPAPKGVLTIGVPGCGKSLTAKATATNYGVPLLKIDLGALKSKFVGESEANLRKAFRVIEAIGRCVVWFDELEKSLAGGTQGAADGGVSADALGALLNWMQERRGEAFVFATANNVSALPPELLRKGRWDETFFVDLPSLDERKAVLAASLRTYGRGDAEIDLDVVAEATPLFSGAEIAALVPDALFRAFNDGARQITTDDLLVVKDLVVPQAKSAEVQIQELRKWVTEGRARPASKNYQAPLESDSGRTFDL